MKIALRNKTTGLFFDGTNFSSGMGDAKLFDDSKVIRQRASSIWSGAEVVEIPKDWTDKERDLYYLIRDLLADRKERTTAEIADDLNLNEWWKRRLPAIIKKTGAIGRTTGKRPITKKAWKRG